MGRKLYIYTHTFLNQDCDLKKYSSNKILYWIFAESNRN